MTGLNHNHKRRILSSLEYADKLLEECLHTPAPGKRPLFSGHVQDLAERGCKGLLGRAIAAEVQRLCRGNPGLISDTLNAIQSNAVPLDDPIRVRRLFIDGRLSHLKIRHASEHK
jgi:hypothetical protein